MAALIVQSGGEGGGNVIEVRQGVGGCLGQMTGFKWHLRECRE